MMMPAKGFPVGLMTKHKSAQLLWKHDQVLLVNGVFVHVGKWIYALLSGFYAQCPFSLRFTVS